MQNPIAIEALAPGFFSSIQSPFALSQSLFTKRIRTKQPLNMLQFGAICQPPLSSKQDEPEAAVMPGSEHPQSRRSKQPTPVRWFLPLSVRKSFLELSPHGMPSSPWMNASLSLRIGAATQTNPTTAQTPLTATGG